MQVGLCDQLMSHLSKYTQQAQPSNGPSTSAAPKDTSTAFAGMKAVTKEDKDDDEFGGGCSKHVEANQYAQLDRLT